MKVYRMQAEVAAVTAQLESRQEQVLAAERAVALAEARNKRREDELSLAEERLRLQAAEYDRTHGRREQAEKV